MRDHEPAKSRRRLGVVTGLLAVGASAAAIAFAGAEPSASGTALPAGDFPEPGVGHAHGLGVDPADGSLYVATHFGLLRLEDGRMHRIANRYQDTMGFEVLGPGWFLGSGHPDFREDNPPLLGLIESKDAGQSWTPLSLRGDADLHDIEAVHDRIYAYDSTSETFMVSDEGREWERRSQLALLDFVVSPDEPQMLVATTQSGLRRSTDGGETWQPPHEASDFALVAWDEELLGITSDGAVHASVDTGRTWSPRGNVGGEPEAMTVAPPAAGRTLYVAVAEQGILSSSDGGRTFQLAFSDA